MSYLHLQLQCWQYRQHSEGEDCLLLWNKVRSAAGLLQHHQGNGWERRKRSDFAPIQHRLSAGRYPTHFAHSLCPSRLRDHLQDIPVQVGNLINYGDYTYIILLRVSISNLDKKIHTNQYINFWNIKLIIYITTSFNHISLVYTFQ